MADVVRMRDYAPKPREVIVREHPATVIILPVVSIERHPEQPKRKQEA